MSITAGTDSLGHQPDADGEYACSGYATRCLCADYGLDVIVAAGALDETTPADEALGVVMAYADDTALVVEAALARLELDARWLAQRAPLDGLRLGLRRHLAGGDIRTAAVCDRAVRIAEQPTHGPDAAPTCRHNRPAGRPCAVCAVLADAPADDTF